MSWLAPQWPAPASVHAFSTLRGGGVSRGVYAGLNLGDHVGDDATDVAANRAALRQAAELPSEPCWLRQVHGVRAVAAETWQPGVEADACYAATPGLVCAVLTADCLPVLLCSRDGSRVAAVHAGWRGLVDGVIERTLEAMTSAGGFDGNANNSDVMAWLGPAIGPRSFEVGAEVRERFLDVNAEAQPLFAPGGQGHWLADLYGLARLRLRAAGVTAVYGGGLCTLLDAERFYSYRRDGVTGRMVTMIWREACMPVGQ
ncbi:MAG: peptidoglycan editing factor PgeF [Chromatiales bacterium]|jgi:YfiH family protein|nr:peptidoglycan editing factor PgeF [Chromatiales bacterium]